MMRDDRQPRIIGAVYIDRDDAQVVRMALNFTRAAFRDPALEDLFVIVENGLIGGRFWLPRRQEIEIRRGGTWLDYPVRGIIRGRWEIGDYQVNVGLPFDLFQGPEIIAAPPAARDTFHFTGRVLDSLPPDVRAVTDAEIRAVQQEARALVRAQALQRPQSLVLSASAPPTSCASTGRRGWPSAAARPRGSGAASTSSSARATESMTGQ